MDGWFFWKVSNGPWSNLFRTSWYEDPSPPTPASRWSLDCPMDTLSTTTTSRFKVTFKLTSVVVTIKRIQRSLRWPSLSPPGVAQQNGAWGFQPHFRQHPLSGSPLSGWNISSYLIISLNQHLAGELPVLLSLPEILRETEGRHHLTSLARLARGVLTHYIHIRSPSYHLSSYHNILLPPLHLPKRFVYLYQILRIILQGDFFSLVPP